MHNCIVKSHNCKERVYGCYPKTQDFCVPVLTSSENVTHNQSGWPWINEKSQAAKSEKGLNNFTKSWHYKSVRTSLGARLIAKTLWAVLHPASTDTVSWWSEGTRIGNQEIKLAQWSYCLIWLEFCRLLLTRPMQTQTTSKTEVIEKSTIKATPSRPCLKIGRSREERNVWSLTLRDWTPTGTDKHQRHDARTELLTREKSQWLGSAAREDLRTSATPWRRARATTAASSRAVLLSAVLARKEMTRRWLALGIQHNRRSRGTDTSIVTMAVSCAVHNEHDVLSLRRLECQPSYDSRRFRFVMRSMNDIHSRPEQQLLPASTSRSIYLCRYLAQCWSLDHTPRLYFEYRLFLLLHRSRNLHKTLKVHGTRLIILVTSSRHQPGI